MQVSDLTENEIGWLAQHLAHDINTHKNFYRLQSSTLELAKVSRILLAAEDGLPTRLQEKSLDDIELKGMNSGLVLTVNQLREPCLIFTM